MILCHGGAPSVGLCEPTDRLRVSDLRYVVLEVTVIADAIPVVMSFGRRDTKRGLPYKKVGGMP